MKTKLLTVLLLSVICGWSAQAQTQLWGTAFGGGATGGGTIFKADASGNNFQIVYSFINATGESPLGNVVLANNGKLYGVTEFGGFDDSCVVYSYEPSTGIYTNIHDFFINPASGWEATSGMIKASNGMLYGLCAGGGAHGGGVIFSIDPATDAYTDIHDFNNLAGAMPMGTLLELSNGKLYGMTYGGGINNMGVIFNFNPSTGAYHKLYDFDLITGGNPQYGELTEASNSKLYGLALGGANSAGVLFSFDLSTNTYADLHDFDQVLGGGPRGSLLEASNGLLYGLAGPMGSNMNGGIFSFDIATNTYTHILDFNGTNGSNPMRSLTQGSNGKLYGTTYSGGIYYQGVAFSFDINSNTLTKLVDFNANMLGSNPSCDLVETPILTTGIAVNSPEEDAAIYPNPAMNSLTLTGKSKDDVIQFIDLLGKQFAAIKVASYSKTTIDITHFPNEFFVKGSDGAAKKIVKE